MLGIDLNAWGVSWCIIGPDGNILRNKEGYRLKGDIELALNSLTSDQAKNRVQAACRQLVALAETHKVAMAIEALNFARKKSKLREQPAHYARMLSRFNSAGFEAAIRSVSSKQGIPLHTVNPAFSSIAGFAKYGLKHNFSVDQASAFQIARYALLGRDPVKPVPTHSKANKRLTPAFRRKLQAKQDSKSIYYQEPVGFSRPVDPCLLQRKHTSQSKVTWRSIGKVLGARKHWHATMLKLTCFAGLSPTSSGQEIGQVPTLGKSQEWNTVKRPGRRSSTPGLRDEARLLDQQIKRTASG